ncbi:fibronectin-like [Strongylocentrotus purpuratus]|uniref:Fibronectin type-III domain-containing protein n=1 Tax=Strongylocentrotus purpuratus TaxID=7668 RepID=A0A7M7P154_STRPU|nr:fibronectin-like [Strongylocentrotus purpuratus]
MDSLVSIFLLTCLLSLSTAQIPGPVQNLVINNIQQWGFTAAWDPPNTGNTPEFYNVTITNTNTNDVYERSLLPNDDGAYEIDHLYDDTTYMFSVVAVNSDGQGGLAVENTGINIPPCQLCLNSATEGPSFFRLMFPATGVTTIISGTSVDASTRLTGTQRTISPLLTSTFFLGLQGGLLYELQMTDANTQTIVYSSRYRTVPNPATNLLLSPDSSTSVQVTYEQPIGTQYHKYDGFRITYGDQERFVGSSDTSVVIDGLQAGISYTFEVQTFSGELADRTYSMPATDDIILVDLFLEANATTSLSVAWALPSIEVSGFQIRYSILDASSFTTLPFGATVTSAILENLEPGKIYRINLYIVTAEGTDLLTGAEFQTKQDSEELRLQTRTSTSIFVSWGNTTRPEVTGFVLRITFPEGSLLHTKTVGFGDVLGIEFSDLIPGTNYTIYLLVEVEGQSDTTVHSLDVTTLPGMPGRVSCIYITQSLLRFVWVATQEGNFDGYAISIQTDDGEEIPLESVGKDEQLQAMAYYLMDSTIYTVIVKSTLGDLRGEPATTICRTDFQFLKVSTSTSTSGGQDLFLDWPDFGASSYEMEYTPQEGTPSSPIILDTSTMMILRNLSPGTAYHFTLFGFSEFGRGRLTGVTFVLGNIHMNELIVYL